MQRKHTKLLFGGILLIIVIVIIGVVLAKTYNAADNHGHDHTSAMAGMDMSHESASNQQSASQAVATNKVTIANYAFSPATITVKAGTTVTWTNQDSVHHSVTADNGKGPKSQLFGQGESYSYTFSKPGTYTYHCEPHPYMQGTVIVTK